MILTFFAALAALVVLFYVIKFVFKLIGHLILFGCKAVLALVIAAVIIAVLFHC